MPTGVRPLLKWAGGKRQLLPTLRRYYPPAFSRYIEPFFGSGAVFFDLSHSGALAGRKVRLLDANRDLVDCYQLVRDRTDAVIACLSDLEKVHARRGADFYYEVRDRRFNPARAAGERGTPEMAAMLIYLNRTGFNGLYRLNRQGAFNVPAGRYADPRICDPEHLRTVAAALQRPGVRIDHGSFEDALETAKEGDFVYCDPPYAPLSATASFAHYTAGGFSARDQARLQQAAVAAATRGATVVLSNSSAPLIECLYTAPEARAARFAVNRVPARRAINSRASARGVVDEFVIANIRPTVLELPKARMLKARLRTAPAVRKRA